MVEQTNFHFWKQQIYDAKEAVKEFYTQAEDCEKEYTDDKKNYNIFYSNVAILDANLRLNNPKPDIQRRFLKRIEQEKKKANLYAEVANILSGAVEYVVDVSGVDDCINSGVHNCNVDGLGVAWIEYRPTVSKDEKGSEYVSGRDIIVESIKYNEFLCSSANAQRDVWWVARRHLLTAKDISARFHYTPGEDELQFEQADQTEQKRGEVWEIWDKNTRKRIFLLLSDKRLQPLEVQDDPYKLEGFFPCVSLAWLRKEKKRIPVPEYKVYEKRAQLLEVNARKTADISDQVKYVSVVGSQDKNIASEIMRARNGDVISLPTDNIQGAITSMVGSMPTTDVVGLLNFLAQQKDELKQDIYDITGISDIMRGVSDARETASAQMIKGLFGSLRFQDRQKQVQNFRKDVYRIIAEIVAEHYDPQTLAEITCTYLPTNEEKAALDAQIQQAGGQVNQALLDRYNNYVNLPTWEEVMQILQNDHLRDYTVDIETTATAFDNQEMQNASIQQLTQMYVEVAKVMATINSPSILKGFIPLAKMNLMSIKVSSSVAKELEEALEGAYNQMEQATKQPPKPNPEEVKIQNERQNTIDKLSVELEKVRADAAIKNREMDIKQQEADRKETELYMQYDLKNKEIQSGKYVNSNIAGDVPTLE